MAGNKFAQLHASYDMSSQRIEFTHLLSKNEPVPEAMSKMARALKPGGIWYLSFKYGDSEREQEGRHFSDMNESRLAGLLATLPDIDAEAVWTTLDKRPGRHERWLNALLKKY